MRCLYREQIHICGNYADVDIYPVFRKSGNLRRRRAKPTSEAQARLNQKNAEKKLMRLLHTNFSGKDYEIHLTYTNDNLPENDDEAIGDVQKFLRRVRAVYKSMGKDLKYIRVTEGKAGTRRYHHHVTLSGGVDRDVVEKLWELGYANCRRLQFAENGVEGLAMYITKESRGEGYAPGSRRFSCSKNLEKPKVIERDGRLAQRKVKELFEKECSSAVVAPLYEGWCMAQSETLLNPVNGGYYISLRFYRPELMKNGEMRGTGRKRRKRKDDLIIDTTTGEVIS